MEFLPSTNPLHFVYHSAHSEMFPELMLVLSLAAVSRFASFTTQDYTEALGKINKVHTCMHP